MWHDKVDVEVFACCTGLFMSSTLANNGCSTVANDICSISRPARCCCRATCPYQSTDPSIKLITKSTYHAAQCYG